MAVEGSGKFVRYERSRAHITVSMFLVNDSRFPFEPGEDLVLRIQGKRIIVEKAQKARA